MTTIAPRPGWADLFAEGRGPRLALICLGVWLNAADSLVTTTIMPTVARDLGGYALFSWATAGYMVGSILSAATAARLSAQFGLRAAMIFAGLVTALGCAISAVAPDMVWLIAGRVVQGMGSGWIVGACYAAIGAMFPERHLARVFGLMTGMWGVATILGPLVGGLFADGGLWRDLFWAFAVQGLIFVGAAAALLGPTPRAVPTPVPWAQLGVVIAGVALIAMADLATRPLWSGLLCVGSLAMFVIAARWKARGGPGLFPSQAGQPGSVVGAGYLAFFCLTAASIGFSVYGPALLQKLYGLSPLAAGYAAGLEALGWTVAALAVAGLSDRWHGLIIGLGAGAIVLSIALLGLVMRVGPIVAILAVSALMGSGFGLAYGFISRRILAAAPAGERELASAGIPNVRLVGNGAGACLAGIIANLLGLAGGVTEAAAQASAVWLFVSVVPLAAIGAVFAWRVAGARIPPAALA